MPQDNKVQAVPTSDPLERRRHGGGSGRIEPNAGLWTDIVLQSMAEHDQPIPVSEKMQALDPQLLAAMPPFLRQLGAKMGKSGFLSHDPNAAAHVPMWLGPLYSKKIYADKPEQMGRPVVAHELTHIFQGSRAEHPNAPIRGGWEMYDYGGIEGLKKARSERKTITDFNAEQQAQMVEDYYSYHLAVLEVARRQGGKLYPSQAAWFEEQKSAFEPFIQQLVGQPERGKPVDTSAPPPPHLGLPPSDITHQLELSPIIAGTMAPIPVAPADKPRKPLAEVKSVSKRRQHP